MGVSICVLQACGEDDDVEEFYKPSNRLVGSWMNDTWGTWHGKYVYTFNSDGTYKWNVGVYENGQGRYTYNHPILTLSSNNGTTLYTIVSFEEDFFVVMSENGNSSSFYRYTESVEEQFISGTIQNHDYVDLGLSVKWATCNVGASAPEDDGNYYAWGEVNTKSEYEWYNYKWTKGWNEDLTKYCNNWKYGYYYMGEYTDGGMSIDPDWMDFRFTDDLTILTSEDDVAYVKWGNRWRMPTRKEMEELCEKCTWTWTQRNGYNGYKVTGPNGRSIFLPTFDKEYSYYNRGISVLYWSASLDEPEYEFDSVHPDGAYYLEGSEVSPECCYTRDRCEGLLVRPVTK